MTGLVPLRSIEPLARPSVSDQVFDSLYAQVRSVELPPGTKLSEAEVAKQLGVSRQPVRDAFFRLSQLGFLVVRPQRATTVSQISASSIFKARFLRTAIEIEIVRKACKTLGEAQFKELRALLDEQKKAVDAGDKAWFHELDDDFHQAICEQLDLGFAWEVIRENKAHTDRVRFLSLSFALESALEDHKEILAAMMDRDPDRAEAGVRKHLGRIEDIVTRLRDENHAWFVDEE